ncbi:MAG TPA: GNAT family N-acetyltransferase [Bauldia sp.]|nr:GNAT family N-acetyltransferase [Bauldia sp.]
MIATTRPATAADILAITAIYTEQVLYGTATFELTPPDAAEMGERMDGLLAAGYPYIAAERDGRLIGYAYAGPFRARPAYRHTVEDSIYLGTDARGQGVGGLLLRVLIEECIQLGFRQMLAVIGDSQNMASIRVHRAAGFRDTGTFTAVGHKFGRWLDVVMMQRALGVGDSTPPERP